MTRPFSSTHPSLSLRFSHAHHVLRKLFAENLENSAPWAVTLRGIRPGGNVRVHFFRGKCPWMIFWENVCRGGLSVENVRRKVNTQTHRQTAFDRLKVTPNGYTIS